VAALDSGVAVEDLALRALARDVGVSATAVYRHFPDKAALLAALALAALDRLGERQARAAAGAADPVSAFAASGIEYVRFALDHPALFRLIWTMAPEGDLFAAPAAASHPAMAGLRDGIAALLPPQTDAATQRAAALTCWGLVHGLAMLALDKQITLDDATITRIVSGLSRTMGRT
jgi:AcrR family transcriptional regulator